MQTQADSQFSEKCKVALTTAVEHHLPAVALFNFTSLHFGTVLPTSSHTNSRFQGNGVAIQWDASQF